ncbi:RagB/SusD family nutrient uptake outer membrane protein [Tamlana sp. 2_MG-2023]|uniref:RagB/SusD family nutrient uptake outer membrane protein n=1 Tax=unclassified Tamlana TaxID=2614803 RepID=UPI0026E3625C|nr:MULTISPECIES: RagB/SusD family nutrient uptake outer membrane protein [unclassified Tamlana]MDO6761235.1 RagB/SusD family nutrient uptake outer membrane protein [Tamlana sp. 2_MG-2023]MDO6791718.1 RagB/SusD family nutrient uptake outer membrane protein [Tamlana sp. 1_MG-2023]
MKQLIFKYTFIALAISFMVSCENNEFLTEENPNFISTETFWTNLTETGNTLNAAYATLHSNDLLNKFEEILRSDMAWPGYGRPNPSNTEEFYLHTYTGSSDPVLGKWQNAYLGIFRANQVIEALENLEVTGDRDLEEWNSQMAQARFLRGLFHFYVYTSYNDGSIVIRDEVPKIEADFNKALSSKQDVIEFVRTDLEFAYKNLYRNGEYPSDDKARATSGAAATILGTTYLYELDYNNAMVYFDDVIKNHGYQIETDLSKMFTTANGDFNSESIFEINFSKDQVRYDLAPWEGESGTNWVNVRTSQTKGAVAPAWAVHAYKTEPMDPLDTRNYYVDYQGNTTLRPVPLRCSAMVAVVDDSETDWYLEKTSESGRFGGRDWGYGWWKIYANHDIVLGEGDLPGGQAYSYKNIVLNRLSDVYLMQAECKIKTGATEEALDLINEIRQRWGLVSLGQSGGDTSHTYDGVAYTADSLMEHLMRVEKPLETSIEGHNIRFLDFQRWKKSDNYSFKKRLGELASQTYYGLNFTFYSYDTNEMKTKFNNSKIYVGSGAPSEPHIVVDYEFNASFLNYDEERHGTYPIPFDETSSNPSIN